MKTLNVQAAVILIREKKQNKPFPIKYLIDRGLVDCDTITALEDKELALTYYKGGERCIILTLRGYKTYANMVIA